MDDNVEVSNLDLDKKRSLKNLKIFKTVLGVLSCATALVTNPIMAGITFAANLGGVIAEAVIDNVDSSSVVAVR